MMPVPSLDEQQRIVERLDSAFENIDKLKANAEKQLTESRTLFQKSLSKAMEPKEGWEEKKLGDVCEIKSLLVNPMEEQYKKQLHVGGANIVSLTGEFVDLKTAEDEQLTSGKFTFNDNDVLYNKIRPYLMKVARPRFCGLCSADMYPLTPKESITKGYLYYVLISKDFTDYAIINSGRAGMPKVNRQTLFAYKCSIPPIAVQQRIVERLDSLSENVRKYEEIQRQIISECDALKQALLRKVFE
jgi:type I restriction enzyme S subunit